MSKQRDLVLGGWGTWEGKGNMATIEQKISGQNCDLADLAELWVKMASNATNH